VDNPRCNRSEQGQKLKLVNTSFVLMLSREEAHDRTFDVWRRRQVVPYYCLLTPAQQGGVAQKGGNHVACAAASR
jgi:hypothetical protein